MVLNNFDEIKLSKEILKFEEKSKKIFTQTQDTNVCWRVWGQGKPIIFLHGGYGSWKHWLKQINFFSKKNSIFIPDMPGFGDSKDLKKPHTPEKIAKNLMDGFLKIKTPNYNQVSIVGFSFGGIIAGHLSSHLMNSIVTPENIILVGPGGLGAKRGPMEEMVRRTTSMTNEQILEAHKKNLGILMFADKSKIDKLSLYIQLQNTKQHRTKSRPISATDTLTKILSKQKIPLYVIWGEKDSTVGPYLEDRMTILRNINPDVRFHVEFNSGHWIMYETPDIFNKIVSNILE